MERNDVIEKIKLHVENSNKWYDTSWTFFVTEIQSWFNIQIIQQLPNEIKIPKYGATRILVNDKGIELKNGFYSWDKISVTGYKSKGESLSYLIVGLNNGEILEELGPSNWRMTIDELGHLIELYKIKYRKNQQNYL